MPLDRLEHGAFVESGEDHDRAARCDDRQADASTDVGQRRRRQVHVVGSRQHGCVALGEGGEPLVGEGDALRSTGGAARGEHGAQFAVLRVGGAGLVAAARRCRRGVRQVDERDNATQTVDAAQCVLRDLGQIGVDDEGVTTEPVEQRDDGGGGLPGVDRQPGGPQRQERDGRDDDARVVRAEDGDLVVGPDPPLAQPLCGGADCRPRLGERHAGAVGARPLDEAWPVGMRSRHGLDAFGERPGGLWLRRAAPPSSGELCRGISRELHRPVPPRIDVRVGSLLGHAEGCCRSAVQGVKQVLGCAVLGQCLGRAGGSRRLHQARIAGQRDDDQPNSRCSSSIKEQPAAAVGSWGSTTAICGRHSCAAAQRGGWIAGLGGHQ